MGANGSVPSGTGCTPHGKAGTLLGSLPAEIWDNIFQHMHHESIRNTRLVNSALAAIGSRWLVQEITVKLKQSSIDGLRLISTTTHLVKWVRKLTIYWNIECWSRETTSSMFVMPQKRRELIGQPRQHRLFLHDVPYTAEEREDEMGRVEAIRLQTKLIDERTFVSALMAAVRKFTGLVNLNLSRNVQPLVNVRVCGRLYHLCGPMQCGNCAPDFLHTLLPLLQTPLQTLDIDSLDVLSSDEKVDIYPYLKSVKFLHIRTPGACRPAYYSEILMAAVDVERLPLYRPITEGTPNLTHIYLGGAPRTGCLIPWSRLESVHWPCLQIVVCANLDLPFQETLEFFMKHSSTLRTLNLRSNRLVGGKQSSFYHTLAMELQLTDFHVNTTYTNYVDRQTRIRSQRHLSIVCNTGQAVSFDVNLVLRYLICGKVDIYPWKDFCRCPRRSISPSWDTHPGHGYWQHITWDAAIAALDGYDGEHMAIDRIEELESGEEGAEISENQDKSLYTRAEIESKAGIATSDTNFDLEQPDIASSPPFELPLPQLPKGKSTKSRARAFATPERSRASSLVSASPARGIKSPTLPVASAGTSGLEKIPASIQLKSDTTYYTAQWGSPYDLPSSTKVSRTGDRRRNSDLVTDGSPLFSRSARIAGIGPSRSRGLVRSNTAVLSSGETAESRAAYDLTGDWIREYHRVRAERKTWLSDGSDNSEDDQGFNSEEGEDWPEFNLPTPRVKQSGRLQQLASAGKSSPSRHRHLPSDATLTQENFDDLEKENPGPLSQPHGMLSAIMSGGIPRRERNSDSISEKPLPPAPLNRSISEAPISTEQAQNAASHKQRSSIASKDGFQRPKKKVVFRGKTITIALPLEVAKDDAGVPKIPLKPEEVTARFAQWKDDGAKTAGFDLTGSSSGDALAGQSRDIYPDASEIRDAFTTRKFAVRIPNKQMWDDYVRQLQEEKLRALGVTLASEEPPARSPSVMSGMSRHVSTPSIFPNGFRSPMEQVISPPGSTPLAQFPFPQAMISPNMPPMVPRSAGLHLASQSIAFHRDRVFSPNALSAISNQSSGQQYLGSSPSSRGVSPLIDDRRQSMSIRSIQSPASPQPGWVQNGSAEGQPNYPPHLLRQLSPNLSHAAPLQQRMPQDLRQQTPKLYNSQPEIASPLPRGHSHRHNVSESLQKEIDDAESHLERTLNPELREEDEAAETIPKPDVETGSIQNGNSKPNAVQAPAKSGSIVSDIETNPSSSNSPKMFSSQPSFSSKHGPKPSISKLNVNAQEFVFNPAKSSFSPMFTFGKESPAMPRSTTSTTGFEGVHSKTTSNTSAFSAALSAAAPAFVPGQPVSSKSDSNRVFSFSSKVPGLKADAPAFTPGLVFGEIPGGAMDKRHNAGRGFAYGDMIQMPKKSKALPIVKPDLDNETQEDEEGRPMQAESRSKRARRGGDSGDQIPLFADPENNDLSRKMTPAPILAEPTSRAIETAPELTLEDKSVDKDQDQFQEPSNGTTAMAGEKSSSIAAKADKSSNASQSVDLNSAIEEPPRSPALPKSETTIGSVPSSEHVNHAATDVSSDAESEAAAVSISKDPEATDTTAAAEVAIDHAAEEPKISEVVQQDAVDQPDYTIAGHDVKADTPRVVEASPIQGEHSKTIETTTDDKPSSTLPSPLHLVPGTPVQSDTALNTADFLDAPTSLKSPAQQLKSTEAEIDMIEKMGTAVDEIHAPLRKGADDPFTIGDHEEGNQTDHDIVSTETVSAKATETISSPSGETNAVTATKAAVDTVVPSTPNDKAPEPRRSTLSATAKPFVFNPAASFFMPGTSTPPSVTPTKMIRPDAPEFIPAAASQPVLKSQSDVPSPEQALSPPTVALAAVLQKEAPPPKKPVFTPSMSASRWATAEPTVPVQKATLPAKSMPTPSTQAPAPAEQPKVIIDNARPATPPVVEVRRRVSSPELSPFASETPQSPITKQYSRPVTPKEQSMEERIANEVSYVEPSFKEIDDVMQQLNGDDSDAGVERNSEADWKSPKSIKQQRTATPLRAATPLSNRLTSSPAPRGPTASPNMLDRPFQYLPKQDYGSSDTEESKIRDAAAEFAAANARFSPSFKRPHSSTRNDGSPVQRLNRLGSGSISNWDDIVSSDDEANFHARVGFFDNRVGHVIANAMDDRLQPIESTLAELTATLSRIGGRSTSRRPRRDRSVESDADDEDEETVGLRSISPFKDHRFEKLKSIVLDAVQQRKADNAELVKLNETIAEMRLELGQRQDLVTANVDHVAVSTLAESLADIKSALTAQTVATQESESSKVLEAIAELKNDFSTSTALVRAQDLPTAIGGTSLTALIKTVTDLQASVAAHQESQPQSLKAIMEDSINKHMRGKSAVVKSSQESATVEKLQLQITGLESMLKNSESRSDEEYRLRRAVEDRLAETERDLKAAIAEARQQADAAEETEQSLRAYLEDHQQSKQHAARSEEIRIVLENSLSDVQEKNEALEETIAEYRLSHENWRKEIDLANGETQELEGTVLKLREELEDGIMARQAIKQKFDAIQKQITDAQQKTVENEAKWRHTDEAHKARHNHTTAKLEAEARTRERLELEIARLEKQEREAMKARTLVEDIRAQNSTLSSTVNDLRTQAHKSQERSMTLERELYDTKERSRLELQRMMTVTKGELETSNQQAQVVRVNLEGVVQRLEGQIVQSHADNKAMKERYQAMLEEASISRDTALREAAEAREAALQEHYRFHDRTITETQVSHERVLNDLKADHTRAFANTHQDHERAISNLLEDHKRALAAAAQDKRIVEQEFSGRLSLSDDKIEHLQEKVKHLEERLAIANSAAQAAAEAARTARSSNASSSSRAVAPSLRGFDPQALRQTVETLQDQLGERERQIETLQAQYDEVDKEAPNKVKERDAEITWLRELLGVRMDDLQDIIVQLSTPHFNRVSVRDAVIRLRANLQMEQQERERQIAGGAKIPSLAEIRASPKALPLAAAAAWGSWRKGQSSLSSLAEMAVPAGFSSTDQTPSKSSPQSFLSGLLTPPSTSIRQSPRSRASLSRPAASRPLAGPSTPKGQIVKDPTVVTEQEPPETPALLTQTSYDADAPEGNHHYSLDRYMNEPSDLPSEDNSHNGDEEESSLAKGKTITSTPTQEPAAAPTLELAG